MRAEAVTLALLAAATHATASAPACPITRGSSAPTATKVRASPTIRLPSPISARSKSGKLARKVAASRATSSVFCEAWTLTSAGVHCAKSRARAVQLAMELGELEADTDAQQLAFEIYALALAVHHDGGLTGFDAAAERGMRAFERLVRSYSPRP